MHVVFRSFVSPHERRNGRWWLRWGVYATALLLMGGGVFLLIPLHLLLPPADALAPVRVEDRKGRLLYELRQPSFGSQRMLPFSRIPQQAVDALIATEDRTFFRHHGVSLRATMRAMLQNVQAGTIVSGGSTLTQQLVRVRRGARPRSFVGKAWEALLALKLDAALTKEEILEQYLGTVSFGRQSYGLAAAADTYFGKAPHELSLGETALLIGLIQSPVRLDPYRNRDGALARRERVLQAMEATGMIDAEQRAEAAAEPLRLASGRVDIRAPHFVFWVLEQLEGMLKPGQTVRTTLDSHLQDRVEDIVRNKLRRLEGQNVTSAAVVVLDAHTGDILAMVGSAEYFDVAHDGAVNVAVSPRQPGSALKPFTYALALARGDTAATTVADTELRLLTEEGNPYTPRNYDFALHGLVRYREALANSYNIPAVRVLEKVGVSVLQDFLRTAGITTLNRDPAFYGLALTLGSGEVRLLELAAAYGIFPRAGRTLQPRFLMDAPVAPGRTILDARVAWLIADILSDSSARLPEFGEASILEVPPHIVAAKTGTTRNARDNWTVGFTTDRIVGVWVGNADNSPMRGTSGVTGAGPIFHDVMEEALAGIPPSPFRRPEGIVEREVCRLSGKIPTAACPHVLREFFLAGTEPQAYDDVYRLVQVDVRNGLRATEHCDPAFVEERLFTLFPPDVRPWARENGFREPPADVSPLCGDIARVSNDGAREALVITHPRPGDSILLDPLIPDAYELLPLTARADLSVRSIEWFVDGASIGTASAPDFRGAWHPVPGVHRIQAVAGEERAEVTIDVVAP